MAERANIVLVMTDQQRWDTLACLGYEHMITPHLDRLAGGGVALSHAFAQGAVCGPSRNSIVSAKYVHSHQVWQNERWLPPDQPNWIERLRESGYQTANIGKMHTAPIRLPCGFEYRMVVENKNYQQGQHGPDPDDYDLFLAQRGLKRPAQRYFETVPDWPDLLGATTWPYDEELFPDNFVGQWAVDYLRDCDFQRPLFMWAGFAGPHDPYDVPASALAQYHGQEVPDPVGYDGELDDKPPEQRRAMAGMEGKRSPAAIWWSRATPERIRRMRRHYYANITLIDQWVGRMVETIEEKGQLDNTYFVFTSDHGDCLGDHHQVYKFSSHYDSVARVPLVVAGPGVAAQGEQDALVELIDLGPTFLDWAGLEPTPQVHGRTLRPLLEGGSYDEREMVFSEHGSRIMARTRAWKLVFYAGQDYGELYHLERDPDELSNLYDDPGSRPMRGQLEGQLLNWYTATRPPDR
ncbi:MAG: sulfatase-like hydrolase/transferase [Candidatus Latescibacteria bacterium]|nr:sulfatase-like hydrolase/transferase [Candidatus Latescibacterota bacterium]